MKNIKVFIVLCTLGLFGLQGFSQCSGFSATQNYTDVDGKIWDLQNNTTVINGTFDAYDIAMSLQVNGTYYPFQGSFNTELAGRQFVVGPAAMSGLNVTRKVYVPTTATDGWARHLDIFENPTGSPITVNLIYESNPGSDGSTTVDASFNSNTIGCNPLL